MIKEAFDGFQQSVAYRLRKSPHEDGVPVTRIRPRALTVPPGFPDFMSRRRVVRPGAVICEGRAWSGGSPVERVDVSVDDGNHWSPAELDPVGRHPWAWRRWTYDWVASPGRYRITARAVPGTARSSPPIPPGAGADSATTPPNASRSSVSRGAADDPSMSSRFAELAGAGPDR